jgi:hypothetical protein
MGGRLAEAALGLLLLVGCGRISFETNVDAGRAHASDASWPDAGPLRDAPNADAGPPDAALPDWPSPVPVAALSSDAVDDDPSLTADLRELYFDSNRPGGPGNGDVWVARRESVDAPWGPPELVAELSSAWRETTPEVSPDGLTLWLASDRPGGYGDYDIWVATRASRTDPWSAPEHVPELSSERDERAPTPLAGGLDMVLMVHPGTFFGDFQLHASSRSGPSEPWSAPERIDALASRDDDLCPHPVGATHLFFASERGGDLDLYVSVRAGPDARWEAPVRLPSLSSPAADNDPWVSPDRRCIWFASAREGRRMQIYESCR